VTNRKKRLQKGIDSLERQLSIHELKLKKAEDDDEIELASYYRKEISAKRRDLEEKKRLLDKGG